jgi:hypothetical protein
VDLEQRHLTRQREGLRTLTWAVPVLVLVALLVALPCWRCCCGRRVRRRLASAAGRLDRLSRHGLFNQARTYEQLHDIVALEPALEPARVRCVC